MNKRLTSEATKCLKELEPTIKGSRIIIAEVGINQRIRWIINAHPDLGDNLAGKKFNEVWGRQESRQIREIAKKILKRERGIRTIHRFEIKGKDHYYDLIVEPIFKYKILDGAICIAIDITDIVKAKKSLTNASEKLLDILGDVPQNL